MPSASVCMCVCVYFDCVGFISDVFAIVVVQISDVKRSKLDDFLKRFN